MSRRHNSVVEHSTADREVIGSNPVVSLIMNNDKKIVIVHSFFVHFICNTILLEKGNMVKVNNITIENY